MQTRLCALKMGLSASNTKAFIAESLGVSDRTVARWFTIYRQHGLDAVLKRGYGIGRPSGLDSEIKAYLLKGLKMHAGIPLNKRVQSCPYTLNAALVITKSGIG